MSAAADEKKKIVFRAGRSKKLTRAKPAFGR
jgi:hypothetical protein